MWLLVLLGSTGLDVGIAAVALNALGVAIIVFVFHHAWSTTKIPSRILRFLLAPFVVLWMFSLTLVAAVGGFSVFLYMALVLLAYVSVSKPQYVLFTPYLAIIIALFRPDGVIIGVGFCLIGLYIAHLRSCIRPYLTGCAIAFFIGVFYFITRYAYFGNLLPLPLYVKSSSGVLAGVEQNTDWLRHHRINLYLLFALVLCHRISLRHLALAMPVIILFAVLSAALQSQNIGYRLQGPLFIILYYVTFLLLLQAANAPSYGKFKSVLLSLIIPFYFHDAHQNIIQARYAVISNDYIDNFSLTLREILPTDITIALTEAGRIPYWNQTGNEIVDLIGLNTAYSARNTVTVEYLESLSPDVIMYHHSGSLILPDTALDPSQPVLLLGDQEALQLISAWSNPDRKIVEAEEALTAYLQRDRDSYDIFLVDYWEEGSYLHVYAIKKQLDLEELMFSALKSSFDPLARISYFAMKRRAEDY